MALQADGKIVTGGLFTTAAHTNVHYIRRFYPDGSLNAAPSPRLGAASMLKGAFQFNFTNTGGHSYTVVATTNVASPAPQWDVLGSPVDIGGGIYQFTDPNAANFPQRFYQLRWP
jgi:hypothetical protein